MRLELVQDRVWAIHPAKLDEINAAVLRILSGGELPEAFAAEKREERFQRRSTPHGDIAVIPVAGTITKRANLFSMWSGGTSTELLKNDIARAFDDPAIIGIVLDIDSPGGTVHGVDDLAAFIKTRRGEKPIVAFTDGLLASAAYWIGSAAGVIVATPTAEVGSIGVALTHYDFSGRDKMEGIVRTEIFAGKYKRIASDSSPLSKEGSEYLQGIVDDYHTLFIKAVAGNRGKTIESVLPMADGKVLIGEKARDIGLVDRIGNFDLAVKIIQDRRKEVMTKEELEKALAEANEKLARAETNMGETGKVLEELARLRESEKTLKASLRMREIEVKVDALVRDKKILPRVVDAGIVQVLMAIDGVEPVSIGSGGAASAVKPVEWILETLIAGTEPHGLDRSVAVTGAAVPKQDDCEALGLSIASMAQ